MKLAPYIACICEGSAETAIIDVLVDNNLLIFTREDMLEENVIRCRSAKGISSNRTQVVEERRGRC